MSEEQFNIKALRDSSFLKKFAQYQTVTNHVTQLEKTCDELNKDIRDTFSVAGIRKEGNKAILKIVTNGKKGEEEARNILRELSEAGDIDVENKTAERYDENEFTARNVFFCLTEQQEKIKKREEGE